MIGWEQLLRRAVLGVSGNRFVEHVVRRYGLQLGASRFVAGETLDAALDTVRSLNDDGLLASLDHLGESVDDPAAARAAADTVVELLEAIDHRGLRANVSIKLTQMGLDIDPELAYDNMVHMLERARELDNVIRIDMEQSAHVDATLAIYRRLRQDFDNVGVVIQAYLYRSPDDVAALDEPDTNVRLVKGAYSEPPPVAYQDKAEVDRAFKELIRQRLIENGRYAAVATHDETIIEYTRSLVELEQVPPTGYEFQMLYGIRPGLQRRLADDGHRVRVYVPYGTEWYPYFSRRLAERPANIGFVLRNLLRD